MKKMLNSNEIKKVKNLVKIYTAVETSVEILLPRLIFFIWLTMAIYIVRLPIETRFVDYILIIFLFLYFHGRIWSLTFIGDYSG